MKISYWQIVAVTFVLVGVALMLSGTGHAQQDEPKQSPAAVAAPVPAKSIEAPKAEPVPVKESSKFATTAEEDKDLRIGQLDAQLAQTQFSQDSQRLPSFAAFQNKLNALQAECNRVIAKHKWPSGTVCDIQTIPIKFCTVPAGVQANSPSPCSATAPTPATSAK